ncbi:MAG: RNA 2',3'-cyclic phosphodiesterase [Geobacter sp.]|nr:RNA 2',3'-cyclic phosphodiesterase [Geobacter sp.]
MYRLFVAVDLPEDVKDELHGFCRDFTVPGARWVNMEQLHLTLRFIGDADEELFQAIRNSLSLVKATQFSLHMEGTGRFPPRGAPHILWVGLSGSSTLLRLQNQVEEAVQLAGISPENRPFSPHITLARLRNASPDAVNVFLERTREFRTSSFTVPEFRLYSSTLTPKGAIHTCEAAYPLELAEIES